MPKQKAKSEKKVIKKEIKTNKKISKVTQLMKIEDTVDPVLRSHQTRLWAEKQIARLAKKQKKNRKRYVIISAILSSLNLLVVILACLALSQLITAANNSTISPEDHDRIIGQIGLAAGAASVTILIFFLNIGIIIYRGFMKWFIYKEALDAIQVEIMKHEFKKAEYEKEKDTDKLLEERTNAITHAALSNKAHKKWKNMLLKALAGGDYE